MKRTHLLLLVLFGGMVTGAAFAQGTDPLMSFPQWASSPALFVLGLIALVKILREKTFSFVDGKLGVFTFAAVLGAGIGAGFQWFDWLAVAPFAEWSTPLGGVAYGVAAAVTGFLGVNLFDLLSERRAADEGMAMLRMAALPAGTQQSVTDFILGLVRSAVSAAKLPAALVAVAPLMAQFAQSEAVLTDDLRSKLQGQVLHLLRKAGLTGVDL